MILPIRTDSPLRTTPWMNWLLIAVNVVIFALTETRPPVVAIDHYWLNPNDLKLFGYVGYAFLHGGVAHLAGNMLFLYIFGNNVNDRMGNIGYLAFYLAGGVFAGMGHVLTSNGPVIGASGAVAAVTGAYLVLLPRSHITIIYFFWLIGMAEIPSLYFIVFFFLLQDVAFFFLPGLGDTGVAHMAHIAGTLFGFSVCLVLLAFTLLPRDQFDVLALIQRWNRRRQFRSMVNQGFDPFGYIPPSRAEPRRGEPVDPRMEQIQNLRAQIAEALTRREHAPAAALYRRLMELDPKQVLSRGNQLDVANQLASEGAYPEAASAYELFLRQYPNYDQVEQVQLMLGLIYARYLQRYDRAKEQLSQAIRRLHGPRELELAQAELARIAELVGPA